MTEPIKAGDVVQVKSGGPRMTVERVGIDHVNRSMCACVWFDDSDCVCRVNVEVDALKVVT